MINLICDIIQIICCFILLAITHHFSKENDELRLETEVKDAAIEQLEKEKEKLKKENSFLMMEIFHNVSGGYQKYKEKMEKESDNE